MTALELGVRFGKTLIVEEADSLPALMQPLVSGDLQGHGSSTTVCIGDRLIDYNKDFKLILCTRNPSPQLLLSAGAYLSVANFTVTRCTGTHADSHSCSRLLLQAAKLAVGSKSSETAEAFTCWCHRM